MSKSKSKSKHMRDHANELADLLAPHVGSAREKAAPIIADAKVKAAPLVAEARDKAAPALAEARDKLTHEVLPVITAALAAASEATEEVRGEAKKRGRATAAALKGEVQAPQKKGKHRLRRLFVVLGLGGVVAAVVKKMSDRQPTTAWQSSYSPAPTPAESTTTAAPMSPATTTVDETPTATAAAAAAGVADDEAAAAPDEALADALERPHAATTPDDPAERIDLDKE